MVKLKSNCQDWREPALELLLQMAAVGGCELPRKVAEDAISSLGEMYVVKGGGAFPSQHKYLPPSIQNLLTLLLELVEAVREGQIPSLRPRIHTVEDVFCLFGDMAYVDQELLKVVFLDNENRLITSYDAALGNINRMWVDPRLIFRKALEWDAQKMVLLHNHPCGHLEASQEDIVFTREIARGCRAIRTKLLDHIILGPGDRKYFSFVEKKIL